MSLQNFEEQFPSLKGKYRYRMASTGVPTNAITISTKYIIENCLDKNKVKEVFAEFCKRNSRYHDITDEAYEYFYKELGLGE